MTAADPPVREGWSFLWQYGLSHYVRGGKVLCGVPLGSPGELTLTPVPFTYPCPHCERALVAEAKGYR
ncbi:hypothetical protein DAETH_28660 [Deinococcus aetherius]|uniref:Uncharacterized protein n=1 Tax=Deinococcus aetherius TaxID=200252 RepID=A0ABM8AGH3_9DEIO|nr:hypothetical protein [Deinococcus aetherius]BDP42897.1 hypothetical protein DAETH_28660 [Deinococcus aetherius]